MIDTDIKIYFAIMTENKAHNVNFFKRKITIEPTHFQQMYENGKIPYCTTWEYGAGKLINPNCNEEIEKLIQKLIPYKESFLMLKTLNNEIQMVLQIVICLGDEKPALEFSKQVIGCVNDVGATIDCDIYNNK